MTTTFERARTFWKSAAGYPANKETFYPEHGSVQEFDLHAKERVFEYGCGGGADALSYLRRLCHVWYADIVPENITQTTSRIVSAGLKEHAFALLLDDSAPIPLAGGYFDVVNCHGVLHHVESAEIVARVLSEFHRLLKRGGALYLMLYSEHLYAYFEPQVNALLSSGRCLNVGEAFAWCTDGEGAPYSRFYTEDGGRALLTTAGFQTIGAKLYNTNYFRTFKAVKS